jgi:DNA repair protein RecO (recombination protein O)
MPLVRDRALVLRAYDYGDSSRILRAYTCDWGLQSFLVRGVKQPKSRFRGVLDLFNLVEVSYVKRPGRSLHAPREADLLSSHQRMKHDLDRTLAFAAIARLVQGLSLEEEANAELFQFLIGIAAAFDDPALTQAGIEPLRHYASWQVLARKGYAPEVDHCVTCGSRVAGNPAFAVAEGGVVCPACDAGRPRLSRTEYGALQLFVHGDGGLASAWRLSADEGRRLDRIREEFAVYHAGARPSAALVEPAP